MRHRQRRTTWLPSSRQIRLEPERAALAALDANLQVAVSSLRAEYPDLGRALSWKPYAPTHLALLELIAESASNLHRLIARYRNERDAVLARRRIQSSVVRLVEYKPEDDDIPF